MDSDRRVERDARKDRIEKEMRDSVQRGGPGSPEGLARRLTTHLDRLTIEDRKIAISILVDAGVVETLPWPAEDGGEGSKTHAGGTQEAPSSPAVHRQRS